MNSILRFSALTLGLVVGWGSAEAGSPKFRPGTKAKNLELCYKRLARETIAASKFPDLEITAEPATRSFYLGLGGKAFEFHAKDAANHRFVAQFHPASERRVEKDPRSGAVVVDEVECWLRSVDEAFKLFNQVGDLIESWDLTPPPSEPYC